jgi:hypothetical protein
MIAERATPILKARWRRYEFGNIGLLLSDGAYSAWVRGEFDMALSLADAVAEEERDRGLDPSGLAERVVANVLYARGDDKSGLQATARQLDLAEVSDDRSRLAHACYMHSVANSSIGNFDEAAQLADRAGTVAAETGSPTDIASALVAAGFAAHDNPNVALEAFDEAERVAAEAGNRWMSAFAKTELSGLLLGIGQLETAAAGLASTVDVWFRFGEWAQQWLTLSRCVVALDELGAQELACQIVGAIELHATVAATPAMASLRDRMLQTTGSLREAVGQEQYDELRAGGAARPVVDIVHEASATLTGRKPIRR